KKNSILQAQIKYAFEVAKEAAKPQIKQAVEKAFRVKVSDVNIIMVSGKTRRVGKRVYNTSPWKKAIVTLRAGDKIEFFEGV
ncbi:MAG TPA: 50S ribosomal protein L23, partial [Dehalococcoidales bacterium]|nr:50S ribosomal protein L23 [Dehalococcoidales bacterium]